MMRPRLFLTGGNGMVGRNIRESQYAKNWEIYAPSRKDLDLGDYQSVSKIINEIKPEILIHAAGRVGGIQANMAEPVKFLDENITIGRNVIMAAFNTGVPKLLNLASTCIYPKDAKSPLGEELILNGSLEPTNEGYALAKIIALRLCDYIGQKNPKLNYKTLIPCNLYGKYDKFNPHNSHLIPAIIHKVHSAVENNKAYIDIWGTGEARREFMYAGDLADFILLAATKVEKLPNTMNVGIGHDFTVNEYYQIISKIIGFNGYFKHDTNKPVGMKRKLCSVKKQIKIGWVPPTSLEEGIKLTYKFYKKNID
ncbi:GDP-L-fucose synthase [Hellea sp.]|nr:GDP-L-fucose synthase [Hellea sp.]MDA9048110.1 GDP-L-fucose synthase [Hellea sp.]